ncbi:MAG: holo-ACP synthase [Spirochaetes bacterium]|nr:holo-ACP synthase [Spirochaetota bacterium]
MILGIGVDIVHVRRIRHWLSVDGLVDRFFHEDEIAASRSRGGAAALSLAARFAAKEAFGKALGTGLTGLRLRDILVVNNFNGKPDIVLFGSALERYRSVGGLSLHLSLTHESDNAVAFVVIEGG